MFAAIGFTLIFAAMTCGLGLESYAIKYAQTRIRRYRVGMVLQGGLMLWYGSAGAWALVYSMTH